MRYKILTKYIDCLENIKSRVNKDDYDKIMQLELDFFDNSYSIYGWNHIYNNLGKKFKIEELDEEETLAVLSYYFIEKDLVKYKRIRNKVIECLKRLKEIDKANKIKPTLLENRNELFEERIRERGEEYYYSNYVEYVNKEKATYYSLVHGTESYDVVIETRKDKIVDMSCSCPYYMKRGKNCKHMYAVIEAILQEDYYTINQNKMVCPICDSKRNIVEIVYGGIGKYILEKLRRAEVVYGGHKLEIIGGLFYNWYCKKCGSEFLNNGELEYPEAFQYPGETVTIKVDREMGSKHPEYGYIYPVNYGYVPDTLGKDGEAIGAYVLGVFEPVKEFTGRCIAVVHREDDNDDKIVVIPEDKYYTSGEIRALLEFQERFFNSRIIHCEVLKKMER